MEYSYYKDKWYTYPIWKWKHKMMGMGYQRWNTYTDKAGQPQQSNKYMEIYKTGVLLTVSRKSGKQSVFLSNQEIEFLNEKIQTLDKDMRG